LEGIKSLIKKNEKIVTEMQEEARSRMPQISEKSRQLASNRTFEDLIKPLPKPMLETKSIQKMSKE